jgi:hypothetical protein
MGAGLGTTHIITCTRTSAFLCCGNILILEPLWQMPPVFVNVNVDALVHGVSMDDSDDDSRGCECVCMCASYVSE